MTRIFIRSLIFNVLFYLLLVFWILVALPTVVLPRRALIKVAKLWGQNSIWLMRMVCGTKVEFRGLEKIPQGPLIVAPKHQSMWETFALLQHFDEPLYILKRELTWIPFFGWLLVKADMIAINRQKGGRILMEMARRASEEVNRGRQLIIFPEGTRTAVGAPPHYKAGIAQIYSDCNVPCLPVALNSGLFWPRRQFMRYPGTIVVEFLDPLPAGLSRRQFIDVVSEKIETASNRLIEAGRREQEALFGSVPSAPSSEAPAVADRNASNQ
ncbi:lysophospholipid acyltransferase family protein [Rhodopseudomonas sp.]|uniref:lysophospholipid acyltransferase family protein n=1 Tax=Rhodopseudomonas sp. TaxID=1078 RepID=UPI003B3A43A9